MTTQEAIKTGIEGIEPEGNKANYLNLMQGLSEQVAKGIEGATPGKIFNTLTGEFKKMVEVIVVGYQWKVVLYEQDEKGNAIETDKGLKYLATVTDKNDDRLQGLRFYNDKDDKTIKKNASKMHVWKVVLPGFVDVYELAFKGTSLRRHDDVLRILKGTGMHQSKTVINVSGKKAEKGAYQVYEVEKGRDATEDEAQMAFDVWNENQDNVVPF